MSGLALFLILLIPAVIFTGAMTELVLQHHRRAEVKRLLRNWELKYGAPWPDYYEDGVRHHG